MRLFSYLLIVTAHWALLASPALAAGRIDVALIADGELEQLQIIETSFRNELDALTAGEFQVRYQRFQGQWSATSIADAFARAYADPSIDMVLAVGVVANQLGAGLESYPKPTFLPVVFDAELLGAPVQGNSSGERNLNYLTDRVEFSENLSSFRRVAPFRQLTLIADGIILTAIPNIVVHSQGIAKAEGVEVTIIPHDGSDHDLAAAIPRDTDAVMLAGLPRLPDAEFQALIEGLVKLRLPSFSLVGTDMVRQGVLAADAPSTDWQRLARRNALNMQAVMLGERAEDQPITFESNRELVINMETARRIGLSPRFDVLSEATLLNEQPPPEGERYNLEKVATLAVQQNLDLLAESMGVSAGLQDVYQARSNWLPQLSLSGSHSQRKVSPLVQAGQFAERSTDAQLALNQILYADDVSANLEIQKQIQLSRDAALNQLRLDIIQAATTAYLNVLRAETQLKVQQENLLLTKANLDLADNRVAVGSASAADVYRWESRLASDRSALLQARAGLDQTRENLNRLLHRPLKEPFQLQVAEVEDPFTISEQEFNNLITNPRQLGLFTDFSVQRGISLSPELAQLQAQYDAKAREVVNSKRAFWLPDFSLSAGLSRNLDEGGVGAGFNEDFTDWSIGVNATLPLFAGGARRAALSRAGYELEQLQALRDSTAEKVEQQIRANMHAANAAYANIELSEQAAEAALKNLELVTDAYAKGVVSIIELLDAQNASLQADQAAANAVYDFLIDIMNVQRAVGVYEFLLPRAEQQRQVRLLKEYIASDGGSGSGR